jgi:NAD(P)-dependent dehydrogenase (short-subunit alcohol dehydrogenase family)
MGLNVRAPFRLMRAAFPHLKERRGVVVNVSSVNGRRVFPNLAVYNTSKAALDHLTRCAAIDWAPHGVRVNAVNPGVTVTNLHRRSGMSEEAYEAFLTRSKETHPLGRPGQASDIAASILFLASDQTAWMTGETIAVDGGRHLTCAR